MREAGLVRFCSKALGFGFDDTTVRVGDVSGFTDGAERFAEARIE